MEGVRGRRGWGIEGWGRRRVREWEGRVRGGECGREG